MRRHHTTKINSAFVRTRRKKLGITIYVAAKCADISKRHWINIEAGRVNPLISTVIRMAEALKCRPDELLAETVEMSINYIEERIQETIQAHAEPGLKQAYEPLEFKEFLIVAKMLGYFDRLHKREKVGYDRLENEKDDEFILNQYKHLLESALAKPVVDMPLLEFTFTYRHKLQNLLTSEQQSVLRNYMTERGVLSVNPEEALDGEIEKA